MSASHPCKGDAESVGEAVSASASASVFNGLTAYFDDGVRMRSRSVSDTVMFGQLALPMPPPAIVADWKRETSHHMTLAPGDVEVMPLARTRARWSGYAECVQAMMAWTRALGLGSVLADSEVALMVCRGASYHHDGARYGSAAFCNLFLTEDKGLDVHFPASGHRVALTSGTAMLFDTGQPHGVIARHNTGFLSSDFDDVHDQTQLFLSWELPIDDPQVAQALGVAFDVDTSPTMPQDEHVALNGTRVSVCPVTGRWTAT